MAKINENADQSDWSHATKQQGINDEIVDAAVHTSAHMTKIAATHRASYLDAVPTEGFAQFLLTLASSKR